MWDANSLYLASKTLWYASFVPADWLFLHARFILFRLSFVFLSSSSEISPVLGLGGFSGWGLVSAFGLLSSFLVISFMCLSSSFFKYIASGVLRADFWFSASRSICSTLCLNSSSSF